MVFVGIDVGSKDGVVVTRRQGKSSQSTTVDNTAEGHQSLIAQWKKRSSPMRICLEATGVYHLDLAVALHYAGLDIMVINPKSAHNFAKVLMSRSKTDAVDADILAQYAERMDFIAWQCPSPHVLEIRACARHLEELSHQRTRLKNQLHAMTSQGLTPDYLLEDNKAAIALLEQRIECIRQWALIAIERDEDIKARYELLLSVKGIADKSAVPILGEGRVLPDDMSARQWVAHTGLDPRLFTSGSSVNKTPRLSQAGNQHVRRAVLMPALSATRWEAPVKAYYLH